MSDKPTTEEIVKPLEHWAEKPLVPKFFWRLFVHDCLIPAIDRLRELQYGVDSRDERIAELEAEVERLKARLSTFTHERTDCEGPRGEGDDH